MDVLKKWIANFICRFLTYIFFTSSLRHLCLLLNAQNIYCALAEILQQEKNDLKFASLMVNNLNMILLTSSELFELRLKLKDLNSEVIILYHSVLTISVISCKIPNNINHECKLSNGYYNFIVWVLWTNFFGCIIYLIDNKHSHCLYCIFICANYW